MSKELLISCDWLQIHADGSDFRHDHPNYNIQRLPVKSRTFDEVWNISKEGKTVATLARKPFSPKIPKGCATIKFENYILYNINRCAIIDQIMSDLCLYTLGTTRIDICGDFRRIANRLPEVLIRDILEERIYKVGHAKATTIGDHQQQRFTTYGTAGRTNTFSYLRYGSRTSRISTYLYNKTKELNEEHDKPYIRDMWRENGWHGDMNVWRLEFSIKGRDMKFIEKDTGEVLPNNPKLWIKNDIMPTIYKSLCGHYFDLRYKTQQRKDREQAIPLWNNEEIGQHLIKKLDATRHSNRADKIFARKLANIANETTNTEIINLAAELGRLYIKEKRLGAWAAQQEIVLKNVVDNPFL
jgi:hypothetical protein